MAKTVYSQNDPIMAELRSLLVSLPVQKIQFRRGLSHREDGFESPYGHLEKP